MHNSIHYLSILQKGEPGVKIIQLNCLVIIQEKYCSLVLHINIGSAVITQRDDYLNSSRRLVGPNPSLKSSIGYDVMQKEKFKSNQSTTIYS